MNLVNETAAPAAADGPAMKRTVLVVDDEAAVRRVVGRILARANFDVLEAEQAEAALEIVRSGREVHAVVTDVIMPGLTGAALRDRLREEGFGMPMVFMSGYMSENVAREALGRERYFVRKPFDAAELVEQVKGALSAEVRER